MNHQDSMRCVAILLLFGAIACSSGDETDPEPVAYDLRVLTANIGNPDTDEPNYPLRLSYQAYEDYVGARIRALGAQVVFLQEVLPPQTCELFEESDAKRSCYDNDARPAAVRRILGDAYSIVCDARLHVECIGVLSSFGTIEGVELGDFVLTGAETPDLPLESCSYFGGTCDDTKCDGESTVSAISLDTTFGPLRVVHAHPNAAGENADGFYMGEPCRYGQLQQIFEGADALVGKTPPVLVAGDFNMDPVRLSSERETELWNANVGPDKRFAHLGPARDEVGNMLPTRLIFSIDHVIADGLSGPCRNHGPTESDNPNVVAPLDSGFDFSLVPDGISFSGRIDHGSISCDLSFD